MLNVFVGVDLLQISSSFDNMDPFGMGQTLPPLQVPQPTAQTTIVPPLKKPPKWVRRPVGASFAVSAPPRPCFAPSYPSSPPLNLNEDAPFDSPSASLCRRVENVLEGFGFVLPEWKTLNSPVGLHNISNFYRDDDIGVPR